MSQQYPSRIRYEYEQDPETRLQYTHGVWGGINPQGEIEISFYLESDKMPPYSERIIAPDGSFGHEIAPYNDEERTITRHIHSRVVMNYHTARAMLEWLEDKVAALEAEEDGARRFRSTRAASSTSEKLLTGEETCFPTFPHRNLFSLFLNFRICCQPNAAPGFGLFGSSIRQSGALEKLLASQIAKRLDASRAASAQPKTFREKGED